MEETLFGPLKGIALLLGVGLMLYPGVLLLQVLTGTVTESIGQIVVLSGLSLLAWLRAIRTYRTAEWGSVRMKASE